MKLSLRTFSLAIFFSFLLNTFFCSAVNASETLPADIRYMLEDLYGANKNKWPSPRYKKDLNNDGFFDWIAKKKNCKYNEHCPAEIFICIPDKTGKCTEYCYIEVKSLMNIEKDIREMKCESTC